MSMPKRNRTKGFSHTWARGDRAYGIEEGRSCEVIGVEPERVKVRWEGGARDGHTQRLPPDALTTEAPCAGCGDEAGSRHAGCPASAYA